MSAMGVIEGFFGPEWPMSARIAYADFLSKYPKSFFIYAPKRDSHLRREWREKWDSEYIEQLKTLKKAFAAKNVAFGVGISPFGLENKKVDFDLLTEKIQTLNKINVSLLGLFFDDMHSHPDLAKNQLEAISIVQKNFKGKIIFCPTFYSEDPILEKVFGKMPDHYWSQISEGAQNGIELIWTGKKVIPSEISKADLEVAQKHLGKKIFLWENIYANDGPKRCKILPLHPYTGRDKELLKQTAGIAFNMLNQPFLSQLVFHSSYLHLTSVSSPEECWEQALQQLCTKEFAAFLKQNSDFFFKNGLDKISDTQKNSLQAELAGYSDLGAKEISAWLSGAYVVGPECLTE